MKTNDLSDFIKEMIKKRGMSLEDIASKLFITKQGLHHWIHGRKNVNWKLQNIILLSEILNFDIVVSNGKLSVKENVEDMKNDFIEKSDCVSNSTKEISLANNHINQYEIFKTLGKYSIVKLYAPNSNLNDDLEVELLEKGFFIYNSKEECLSEHPQNEAILVYGLVDNETGYMYNENAIYFNPYILETFYYTKLAPTLEKTGDGFEVVLNMDDKGVKIVKVLARVEVINSAFCYPIEYVPTDTKNNESGFILGLLAIKSDSSTLENCMWWGTNIENIYRNLNIQTNTERYFDRLRNEINPGDTLIYKGYKDYMVDWDLDNIYSNENLIDNFNIDDVLVIRNYKDSLIGQNTKEIGLDIKLSRLNLLKWEKYKK